MRHKMLMIGICVMLLAGCATSTRYVSYTFQAFAPKDPSFSVNVYPKSQKVSAATPYYVIGKISIEGFASNGVNPGGLTNQARDIARRKGADAIINAQTEVFHYYYGDELLRFNGELIVYAQPNSK